MAGIHPIVLKTMTGEKLCEVIFRNVAVPRANILGELHQGWPIIKQLLKEATVAECAWMTGGARYAMETAVAYAKERVQFGVPIGSFQIIQHKCVDMLAKVEGATSITYYAAWAVAENDPQSATSILPLLPRAFRYMEALASPGTAICTSTSSEPSPQRSPMAMAITTVRR